MRHNVKPAVQRATVASERHRDDHSSWDRRRGALFALFLAVLVVATIGVVLYALAD